MKNFNFNIKSFDSRLKVINKFDGNLIFNVKKFHEDTGRSDKIQSNTKIPKELNSLLVKKKGFHSRKKNLWENNIICPNNHVNFSFKKNTNFQFSRHCLDIYKCNICDLKILNPRVKYSKALELYGKEKTHFNVLSKKKQVFLDKQKYRYGVDLINFFSKKKNKLVDLGCGPGLFLKEASYSWNKCFGIDLNINYKKIYNKHKNIEFLISKFENLNKIQKINKINCVSLWNVFEHIYKPNVILKKIYKVLDKNGLILVVVPNSDSLISKIARNLSPTFNWQHVFHYNKKSLNMIMMRNGFKCVHFETIISEINNVKSYLSGKFPYSGYGDPDNQFSFITPKYIHKNLFGSRILAIYKKI